MNNSQEELLIKGLEIACFTAGKMFSKNFWPEVDKTEITEKVKENMKDKWPKIFKKTKQTAEVPGMEKMAEEHFKLDCAEVGTESAKELRDEIDGKREAEFDKNSCYC